MKRRRLAVLIFIVAAMILQMLALGVYAEGLKKDGELKINVELGYDGVVKLGNTIPIFFEIENNLKDINGELQVELPDDFNDITIYATNISLPKNTTKQFVMYVPIMRIPDKLNINIVQGKSKVMTKTIRPVTPLSSDTLIIGMLSDDYESIRYIDKVPTIMNNNFKTVTLKLDEIMFPDNIDALRMFNVLLINNYDTSKLSDTQYDAIKQWVIDGGLLMIGTGPSYTKTLAVFKDDFITGDIKEVSNISTGVLSALMNTSIIQMNIDVLNMKLQDAEIIVGEGSIPLVQKLAKGKGVVALTSFDFGLEPLTSWVGNKKFSESLIGSVLPASYSSVYFEKQLYMRDNYYAMDNSLRSIPELPQPNPFNLLIIFAIYILLAAPISYIVLKKLDKRELMWITVPIISVAFAIIMYLTGYGTRLTEPLANVISIINIDNTGVVSPTTYAGVFTPNKTNMRIETDETTTLKPMTGNNQNMYGRPGTEEKNKIVSKVILGSKPAVEFYKAGVWSMKNVLLQHNNTQDGIIESSLNYSSAKITGTIKNLTKYDLTDCYLITNNQYLLIGDIKSGESINVDNASKGFYGDRYDLISALYKEPQNYRISSANLSKEQISIFRENMQKRQILEYYFWNFGEDSLNVKLIGWSKSPAIGDIIVNNRPVEKIEKSFVVAEVNLNFRQGDKIEYPMGFIRPNIMNNLSQGSYDEMSKMFYGRGTVEIVFPIENDIEPSEIIIDCKVSSPNIKKYIFNYGNGIWEEFSGSKLNISEVKMKDYFNGEVLTLKLELNDDNAPLPQISLKGSVK